MVQIKLYNTLTKQVERFEPADPANVRVYLCGPTVYDFAHVGNARSFVFGDNLNRLLRLVFGSDHVTFVRNITDVDDKIINRAIESGRTIRDITDETNAAFQWDMQRLGVLEPDHQPRATDYIAQMGAMIQTLVDKGHAYQAPSGDVMFHVPSMPTYGALSGRSQDELEAGARVEVNAEKRDPSDFLLWKAAKSGEPDNANFDSPFGRGRPGWHIECSAMAKELLTDTFDIHAGGIDLVFPHHENEIAQSCCANDTNHMARYWMHGGFLNVNGTKMSKSLDNFFTVRQLMDQGVMPEAIRFQLMQAQYSQPHDISKDKLDLAKAKLDDWYRVLDGAGITGEALGEADLDQVDGEALAVLANDLNTPGFFARLEQLRDDPVVFRATANVVGLLTSDPAAWFKGDTSDDEGAEINALVQERIDAKKAKDFARADEIRALLTDRGIVLEDKPGGVTQWRKA